MNKIKLRRHETFSLREGWLQKGLDAVEMYGGDTFNKEKGIKILGIGSNMVKSLKYWMIAGNVIKSQLAKVELTEFGKMLYKYDRYLEDNFSWCLYHYFLSTKFEESPIIYYITNIFDKDNFNKDEMINEIYDYLRKMYPDCETNKDSIVEDVNMYIRLYIEDKVKNPEDNFISPLSSLRLLENGYSSKNFIKVPIDVEMLDYRIVFYILENIYKESFEINEVISNKKSPIKVFNLNRGVFSQYLNLMKNDGLITINKTAGLNTVYFNKKMSLEEIFDDYFGGKRNV